MNDNHIIINDSFKHHKDGVLFYIPHEGAFCENQPSQGFGSIKQDIAGTIYTGNLYYDGTFFHKIGFGQESFEECGQDFFWVKDKLVKFSLFVGEFDYRKNNWIYGKGVLYCRDQYGFPIYFVKGFFKGLEKISEWDDFDYSTLASGYNKEMEIPDLNNANCSFIKYYKDYNENYLTTHKKYNILLIGDSYLGFIDDTNLSTDFKSKIKKPFYHLSINGAGVTNWNYLLDDAYFAHDPVNIVLYLGLFDIIRDNPIEMIQQSYSALVQKIKRKFPSSKIYVLTYSCPPFFEEYKIKFCKLNRFILEKSQTQGYRTFDMSSNLFNIGTEAFAEDKINLSKIGQNEFLDFLTTLE